MNEFFLKIKKLLKIATRSVPSNEYRGIRPVKEWKVMLVTLFSLLVIITGVELYIYLEVSRGTLFTVPMAESNQSVTINQKLLNVVMTDISTRRTVRESLASSTTILPDLSQ